MPLPGRQGRAEPARAALALGFTLALFARWPAVERRGRDGEPAGRLGGWRKRRWESPSAWRWRSCSKSFAMAAQVLGLQAGYAFASTIDPNTQADSGVLVVFAQLMAGLLFFALGLDREVLRCSPEPGEGPGGSLSLRPRVGGSADPPGRRAVLGGRAAGAAGGGAAGAGGCGAGAAGAAQPATATAVAGVSRQDAGALVVLAWMAALFPRILLAVRRAGLDGRAPDAGAYEAAMADQRQKTEQPTQRRLQKAREEGQFPAAREFVAALQFLAFAAVLERGRGALAGGLPPDGHALLFSAAFARELTAADLTQHRLAALLERTFCRWLVGGMAVAVATLALPADHHAIRVEPEEAGAGRRAAESAFQAARVAAAEPAGAAAGR